MRSNQEYQLCRQISTYMHYQFPNVLYRFDMAGLSLSKAQAGMNKAIQNGKGWPDLFIAEPRGNYHGLLIELKKDGEMIYNKKGECSSPHILEQSACICRLNQKGYKACFAIGFDEAVKIINEYLKS